MKSVGIVGGGPGGLALSYHLSRAGFDVSLFEAGSEFGGLARSFSLGGTTIERYYHFICGGDRGYFRMLKELGIKDRLRWSYTQMGYFYDGVLYPFSSASDLLRFDAMKLTSRIRYGLATAACSLLRDWKRLDQYRAKPWLISWMGRECYDVLWHPLLSVKFPDRHEEISAAWVWHRIHRVADSRKTLLHREQLGYLEGGTRTLIDALENRLVEQGVSMYPNHAVARVLTKGNQAIGVATADGKERHFDYVVSAVPLPVFVQMAPTIHQRYFDRLAQIGFIGVVCIVLKMRRQLTPNFWTNIHDRRIPFNGCIEYTNMYSDIAEDGSTILYVPHYLPVGHERFDWSKQRLIDECLEALPLINPEFSPEDVLDVEVSRDPLAQIICPTGFAEQVPGHRTPIDRLFLLESSQLYPSDRAIGPTLDLADNIATLICQDEEIQRPNGW